MKLQSFIAIILFITISVLPICMALKGSIKTTRADGIGNVNQYAKGETVYIKGKNFDSNLDLTIVIYKVNEPHKDEIMWTGPVNTGSGEFLVPTWFIPTDLTSDYEGEYKAEVQDSEGNKIKSDNFRILSFVIPDVPLGTLGTSAVLLAGLLLYAVKKRDGAHQVSKL